MKKKNLIYALIALGSIIFSFMLIVGIPLIINESYLPNKGYITLWGAPEVLSYYGAVLSFIGTVILGVVAVWQNKKANDLSETVMQISLREKMPYLKYSNKILKGNNNLELEFENHGNSFGTIYHLKLDKNGETVLIKAVEHFIDQDGKYICTTNLKVPNDTEKTLYINCEFVISNAFGFAYKEILKMQFTPELTRGETVIYSLSKYNILFRELKEDKHND